MGQLVVRNLEDSVKERLQRRAKLNRRSMEEEVRDILRNAAHEPEVSAGGLGSDIASAFAETGLKADIPELRGSEIKPPSFRR